HAWEEGGRRAVGGAGSRGKVAAGGRRRAPPRVIALEDVRVVRGEHLRRDRVPHHRRDVGRRRPDVVQVDGGAVGTRAERLAAHVDVHRSGQRVRDDQRRGGGGGSLYGRGGTGPAASGGRA